MLKIFYGANQFAKNLELSKLRKQFSQEYGDYAVKLKEAVEVDAGELLGEIAAVGMFSQNELIIISGAQENVALLEKLVLKSAELEKSDKTIVCVVGELDKRKKIFKDIKKLKEFREFVELSVYDLEKWIKEVAKKIGINLNTSLVRELAERVGGSQQEAWVCLNQLSLLEADKKIESADLDIFLKASTRESVFELLESALSGNQKKVSEILKALQKQREDPFRGMGLLVSQASNILAIVLSKYSANGTNVAKDFGVHPYALSQLQNMVNRIGIDAGKAKRVLGILSQGDEYSKTINKVEPWLMLDSALMKIGSL